MIKSDIEKAFVELRFKVCAEVSLPPDKRHTFDYIEKCRKRVLKSIKGVDEI